MSLGAPCGLYCGSCSELVVDRTCHGCACDCGACTASAHRAACAIYQCSVAGRGLVSCADCTEFPCTRLIQFCYDPIWRTHLPILESLRRMRKVGMAAWVEEQQDYWKDWRRLQRWLRLNKQCRAAYTEMLSESSPD